MKKNPKSRWVIPAITILCIGMICFFSTLKQNARVRIWPKQVAASSETEEEASEDQNKITVYSYPYYGMSEADLNHCLLGKPMIVSECSDFDKKTPKDRIRYYYFGYGSGKNSGKIIVRYRKYNNQGDGYIDLSSDNGYVDSGYYVDQSGTEYRLNFDGITKVEEETDTTTKTTTEETGKSGGRLLPGSRDSGNGSSAGGTSSKKSTSATTEFDPDDHDIEAYYEDNIDEFDSIDDAYDAFEDDEDAWDYY